MAQNNLNSKQIPQQRWLEFFDMFGDGNRGRTIAIEVINQEFSDEELIKDAPLFSIIYDPPDKDNNLALETGKDEVNYAHNIVAPTEVWEAQDENGEVVALEIKDESDTKTILRFEQ